MVSCAYELQHYLTIATDVEISDVHMLCPPALTGSGHWRLEELAQITYFQGVAPPDSAVLYRTSQGAYKIGELDLRKKKISRVWFSKKRLENLRPRISERVCGSSDHQMYAPLYLKAEPAFT